MFFLKLKILIKEITYFNYPFTFPLTLTFWNTRICSFSINIDNGKTGYPFTKKNRIKVSNFKDLPLILKTQLKIVLIYVPMKLLSTKKV